MTGLAIGSIKAPDEISEVVVVLLLLVKTKPLGRGSWTHLSLLAASRVANAAHRELGVVLLLLVKTKP